jgi:hypothetical protein
VQPRPARQRWPEQRFGIVHNQMPAPEAWGSKRRATLDESGPGSPPKNKPYKAGRKRRGERERIKSHGWQVNASLNNAMPCRPAMGSVTRTRNRASSDPLSTKNRTPGPWIGLLGSPCSRPPKRQNNAPNHMQCNQSIPTLSHPCTLNPFPRGASITLLNLPLLPVPEYGTEVPSLFLLTP